MQNYHRSNNKHLNFNIHYLCKVDHPFSTTGGISDSGWPLDSKIWRGRCAGMQDSKTAPARVLLFLSKASAFCWLASCCSKLYYVQRTAAGALWHRRPRVAAPLALPQGRACFDPWAYNFETTECYMSAE